MKKIGTLLVLCLMASVAGLNAQVSFSASNQLFAEPNSYSGVAIGVADLNGDGFDDIAHLRNGRILTVEYQRPDGSGFNTVVISQVSTMSQWSLCIADVDNNGLNDILTGGRYDGMKLYKASGTDSIIYTSSLLPGATLFVQGSNFADINNDGWVDAFGCHDDGESRIWGNDGTGNFATADNWIDMATVPASDNSGNYGSVWADFDDDGDLDLYIAKCRQGVNDPSDPRRINALFVNDGNNNFTEAAEAANLKIGAQSWTADFGDIDNDGDLDCFITNHDVPSMLMLNDGTGVFTDITAGSGVDVGGLPLQGIFRDMDNDGWVDILVSGTAQYLFHNNGDNTFTEVQGIFNNNAMESFAVGDLNHDGLLDIYGGYAEVYTTPSNIADVLWLNTTDNDNHFLAVTLVGDTSNRNGIGAKLSIYGSWGVQVREVRSGESYGIMNSFTQHFGLGANTMIDSMTVRWPSGTFDSYYGIAADQFLTLLEGNCVPPTAAVTYNGPTVFCPGESLTLTSGDASSYLWSNGETTQSIVATTSGNYSVIAYNEDGCSASSAPVVITVDPVSIPDIAADGDTLFCAGGSVTISTGPASSYLWSTGETTPVISATITGDYFVTTPGLCSDFTSATIHVEVLPAPAPEITTDTIINEPAEAILTATGDAPRWYDAPMGGNLLAENDTLIIPFLTETTTYYVEDPEFYPGPLYFGGAPEHTGNSQYSGNQFNGELWFDSYTPFTLRSVKVYTDTPGDRIIELRDANDNVLQSLTVNIPMGESVLDLNFAVPVADGLKLTTNTAQNNTLFGYNSPRLQRTNGATVTYPYVTPGVLSINEANFGTDVYYYFYNWEIKLPDAECVSERVPVEAVFLVVESTNEAKAEKLALQPNPSSGEVTINLPAHAGASRLQVMDAQGRPVWQQNLTGENRQVLLSLAHLPNGVYMVQVQYQDGLAIGRVVLQR